MFLSYDRHFIDKIFGSGIFVDNEKYVTYIDIDAALQVFLENNVAAHGFPVAVEGCAYQFAIGIDDRTARVAARNVVVTEETARQVAVFHGIFAKIFIDNQLFELGRNDKFPIIGIFFFENTPLRGVIQSKPIKWASFFIRKSLNYRTRNLRVR